MFENTKQQSDNKLLLLFVLEKLDLPVTGLCINDIMLEPGWMSYFSVQIALNELVTEGLVSRFLDEDGIPMYVVTQMGRDRLDAMNRELPKGLAKRYEQYINRERENIRRQLEVNASYFTGPKGEFYVRCFLRDGADYIMDLKIPAGGKQEAARLCRNWKEYTAEIYLSVLQSFYRQDSGAASQTAETEAPE